MPNLDSIPAVYYQPTDPYNYVYDNLPIINLVQRQQLINSAVDLNSDVLRAAVGTQGTLANRLAQSINENGTLRASAVNSVLHNIGDHTDGTGTLSPSQLSQLTDLGYAVSNPVSFVRMTEVERDKLALISDEATALRMQVQTPSTTVVFENETVVLDDSDSVTWSLTAPNRIRAHMAVPLQISHRHFYDLAPEHVNTVSPDYINYKVTSVATPYMAGTLRVYVNGIRLGETASVYVPPATGPDGTWALTRFTADAPNGRFTLSRPLVPADVIRVDFDTAFE
jgi:hypothetical protein